MNTTALYHPQRGRQFHMVCYFWTAFRILCVKRKWYRQDLVSSFLLYSAGATTADCKKCACKIRKEKKIKAGTQLFRRTEWFYRPTLGLLLLTYNVRFPWEVFYGTQYDLYDRLKNDSSAKDIWLRRGRRSLGISDQILDKELSCTVRRPNLRKVRWDIVSYCKSLAFAVINCRVVNNPQ
jgi:hypothetical protein